MSYLSAFRNHSRHECLTRSLFIISFLLLLLTLPLSFINEKSGRIIFYFCSYLSIFGILINSRKIKSIITSSKIVTPFFVLSAMYFIWSVIAKHHAIPGVDNGLLFTPAKRWFLATLISMFILWGIRQGIISKKWLYILTWSSLSAAFLFSSAEGIWQHINHIDRITLGINRATMTAYAYSAMALSLMTMLSQIRYVPIRHVAIILTYLLSVYIIFLTETRSAMFIHIMLGLILTINALWQSKSFRIFPVIAIILSFVVIAILGKNIVESRFDTTKQEISRFNEGDDHTSLGSRFTMWKSGMVAITKHPFGETQITRNNIIRQWLNSSHNANSFALDYIDVHLHNEFIQYASLFGIFGVIALLFFYGRLLFDNSLVGFLSNPVSLVVLSALLYGITDVLLTSVEYVVVFSTLILLACANIGAKTNNAREKQAR
ncbi:O-antigen ligase family protein [Erwinia psidii]|uniref:O-antigen ligase family protein n=1 Tax=Erwinia psidii TaxID=69224 RepID=A0A3N6V4T1_9GAMM|nr:O-antigen ligase family protein [Erwinia psidii]MCX8956811.1 O-antigen ligase family protein [Erwinia psidii]MCX8960376.1 O-antigen ligase family protein [Erwinia psidii]MCX8964440.1 O-antigen ligase family protein [Erwinia psidii]RQM40135.1 O-antigen ligase family protein [Erwinia psidii]